MVDLPTILDRVDSTQRLVPTYEELAGALRRAGDAGRIRQVAPGQYVDARRSKRGGPVSDLSAAEYSVAIREYHEAFTGSMLAVGPWLKAPTAMFELAYKLTGGRFGLEPGMVDVDGASLSFVLDDDLEPIGWRCEGARRVDGVRRVGVAPIAQKGRDVDRPADRSMVIAIVTAALERHRQFRGAHRIVFPDADEVDIPSN